MSGGGVATDTPPARFDGTLRNRKDIGNGGDVESASFVYERMNGIKEVLCRALWGQHSATAVNEATESGRD